MKKLSVRNFIRNVYALFIEDLSNKELLKITRENAEIVERNHLFNNIIFSGIDNQYKLEVENLLEADKTLVFPYKQLKSLPDVGCGIEEENNMPYVIHNGKKLFFPYSWTLEQTVAEYRDFIEVENLLGGNYMEKCPHQYESAKYCVKEGDVVFDIGCAEGLFALEHIEKASKVYLIESSSVWHEALNATFEPYKDKVTIIPKLVSNSRSDTSITLSELIALEIDKSLFVKMDIDGSEISVFESGKALLSKDLDISLVCCTYHKQNDAKEISALFDSLKYKTEFSDGYVLFIYDNEFKYPFFRKGLIRASKK